MIRNMEKTTEKMRGQFNDKTGLDRYDMNGSHMIQLIRKCKEGNELEALEKAFLFGFVLGNRATVDGKLNKRL